MGVEERYIERKSKWDIRDKVHTHIGSPLWIELNNSFIHGHFVNIESYGLFKPTTRTTEGIHEGAEDFEIVTDKPG